jgi:hypothetical protein
VAYIAPQRNQAKQVAWDYAKPYSRPIPGVKINEAELRIDYPNGGRLQLFGADNPDSLRGIYLDAACLDEFAQMPGSLLPEVIRPALSDRQGRLTIIGTPKGRNAFFDLYTRVQGDPDWFVRVHKASETGLVAKEELKAARQMMSEDEYSQEYECSWTAAIRGAYFAKELQAAEDKGRISTVAPDDALLTHTAWDLGVGDATAIWWWQEHGTEIRLIDYYEATGEGLKHYINVVADKKAEHGLTYGTHFAPHDIQVRELGTGQTRLEVAQQLGIHFHVLPRSSLEDGIDAARRLLNRTWIDRGRCQRGLECLWQYHKSWDDKRQEFRLRPEHDFSSHGADAFRYLAMASGLGHNDWAEELSYPQRAWA